MEDYSARLQKLERRTRRLTAICAACALTTMIAVSGSLVQRADAQPNPVVPLLRVHQLSVIDDKGVERVRIGAPLPDPIQQGRRFSRGGTIAGILLYDAAGNERSGYATADGYANALLTLDSVRDQRALFLTEPDGATTFRLLGTNDNMTEMQVGSAGPRIRVVEHGKTVFDQPPKLASPAGTAKKARFTTAVDQGRCASASAISLRVFSIPWSAMKLPMRGPWLEPSRVS